MPSIVVYDPYLEILGGGEKYLLTLLETAMRDTGGQALVLSPRRPNPRAWRRLNVDLDVRQLRWRRAGQLRATALSAGADLFVTLFNHFPALSLARHSVAIVQYPFASLADGTRLGPVRDLDRRLRLRSYDTMVCYSEPVAAAIRSRLEIPDPCVIAPPVDIPTHAGATPKRPMVLAVGRFFPAADANNKKHDEMIDAWRRLSEVGKGDDWELHLAGGVAADRESQAHLAMLRERAAGLSVSFHPNVEPERLRGLYEQSTLFWHAAGLGETAPERHEHFGITTVEAMAHGCVPVVIGLGGQREIVTDRVTGRLWDSLDQLVAITRELIRDPEQTDRLGRAARTAATRYGKDHFVASVRRAILVPAGLSGA